MAYVALNPPILNNFALIAEVYGHGLLLVDLGTGHNAYILGLALEELHHVCKGVDVIGLLHGIFREVFADIERGPMVDESRAHGSHFGGVGGHEAVVEGNAYDRVAHHLDVVLFIFEELRHNVVYCIIRSHWQ